MSILLALAALLIIALVIKIGRVAPSKTTANRHATLAMRAPHAPMDLFVDSAHSWIRMMADGTLRVGLDAFLGEALGRVDAVRLPEEGTSVSRGDTLFTIKMGDKLLKIPSPVNGVISTRNTLAIEAPATVTSDPYGLGWVLAIRSDNQKEALAPLHVGRGALGFLRQETTRLADFFTMRAGQTSAAFLGDGGLPQRGAVSTLDAEGVAAFAEAFLAQR